MLSQSCSQLRSPRRGTVRAQPMNARSWGENVLSQERRVRKTHVVTPTIAQMQVRCGCFMSTRLERQQWYAAGGWTSMCLVHVGGDKSCACEKSPFAGISGLTSGLIGFAAVDIASARLAGITETTPLLELSGTPYSRGPPDAG
jgi:hypothetical protein